MNHDSGLGFVDRVLNNDVIPAENVESAKESVQSVLAAATTPDQKLKGVVMTNTDKVKAGVATHGASSASTQKIGDRRVICKLDRAMVNNMWCNVWPSAETEFRNPGISDHCPILVEWNQIHAFKALGFKFFNMWSAHKDFKQLVQSSWSETVEGSYMYQVCRKLQKLQKPLSLLNRNCYSKIGERELVLKTQLDQVQNDLMQNPSDHQLQLAERILAKENKIMKTKQNKIFCNKFRSISLCRVPLSLSLIQIEAIIFLSCTQFSAQIFFLLLLLLPLLLLLQPLLLKHTEKNKNKK
ncbi:hypothetical protein RIF29_38733 [Crotalaria pallida]|uniref:Uncharacterized protein n=1 Tax=Crotalaria pallida TaxID=3830 RepID=A0AAN9E0J7_CROPI